MSFIRITKEFNFEMAHALMGYDGLCKNVHGHSYKLEVTIKGTPIKDETNCKLGMVMDFSDLKKIIKSTIIDRFDHALVLFEKMPHHSLKEFEEMFGKVIFVPFQPTTEEFLSEFAKQIKALLPKSITLFSLKLRETESSYAEWYAEDNP